MDLISNHMLVFGSQCEHYVFKTICVASNFLKETMFCLKPHSPLPYQRSKTLNHSWIVLHKDVLVTVVLEKAQQICVCALQFCSLSRLLILRYEEGLQQVQLFLSNQEVQARQAHSLVLSLQ